VEDRRVQQVPPRERLTPRGPRSSWSLPRLSEPYEHSQPRLTQVGERKADLMFFETQSPRLNSNAWAVTQNVAFITD